MEVHSTRGVPGKSFALLVDVSLGLSKCHGKGKVAAGAPRSLALQHV